VSGVVILAHIHYGTCVVAEMCHHLNIQAFSIRHKQASPSPSGGLEGVSLLSAEEDSVSNGVASKEKKEK